MEQALSKAQREKEELCYQKEDLEARLKTYKDQQRQGCVPCRSCKPVHTCTCMSESPISAGNISAAKVFTVCKLNVLFAISTFQFECYAGNA